MEQTACDSILYGHKCHNFTIRPQSFEYLAKGFTANKFRFLIFEVCTRSYLMIRALGSLYGNFLHLYTFYEEQRYTIFANAQSYP